MPRQVRKHSGPERPWLLHAAPLSVTRVRTIRSSGGSGELGRGGSIFNGILNILKAVYVGENKELSSVQNLCWLMIFQVIILNYTTRNIGDDNNPVDGSTRAAFAKEDLRRRSSRHRQEGSAGAPNGWPVGGVLALGSLGFAMSNLAVMRHIYIYI